MGAQLQRLNNFLRQLLISQVIECPVCILNHIMEKSHTFLRIGLPHGTYDQRMEDNRITIPVALSLMGIHRNLDAFLYCFLCNRSFIG